MTDEPANIILKLLRDIRAKQDEHDKRFDAHDHQFNDLNKAIEDWRETTATGDGFAAHANIRTDALEKEIEALKRRIDRLEGSERH
jgi:predicted  nucleic acid-binding Zn-ribbon protein